MKNFFIVFAALLSIASSCTKNDDCPRTFEIPISVSPQQEEYHIGDTIEVVSKFHRKVKAYNFDENEVGSFDMKGINWKPVNAIYRIDTLDWPDTNEIKYSILTKYFEFIIDSIYDYKVFTYSNGSTGAFGEYSYVNDSFEISYQLVPKHIGLFYMENGSDLYAGAGSPQEFPGDCKRHGGFDVWVKMNDGADNNIHLLKESPHEHWNTWVISKEASYGHFSHLGGYCFRVVP